MPVTIEIIELDHQQWYLCLNGRFRYCCGKDTNGKTNVTAEHFIDEDHNIIKSNIIICWCIFIFGSSSYEKTIF